MIRHVVMFRWTEDTDAADIDAIEAGLRTMPELIPEIRDYRFGPDLGINDTNWDFVVVADFATTKEYTTYRERPRATARLIAEPDRPAPR